MGHIYSLEALCIYKRTVYLHQSYQQMYTSARIPRKSLLGQDGKEAESKPLCVSWYNREEKADSFLLGWCIAALFLGVDILTALLLEAARTWKNGLWWLLFCCS